MPSSNIQSWENKFEKNKANDRKSHLMLSNSGWRILTVWECALRSTNRFMNENEILTEIATEMISETGMQTNINHYPQPVYPS
jgi:DNA mismatch endonuclease (patch repair protein)